LGSLHRQQLLQLALVHLECALPLMFDIEEAALLSVEELRLLLKPELGLLLEDLVLLEDRRELLVFAHLCLIYNINWVFRQINYYKHRKMVS
jgi:hypothetical protein